MVCNALHHLTREVSITSVGAFCAKLLSKKKTYLRHSIGNSNIADQNQLCDGSGVAALGQLIVHNKLQ